MEGPMGFPNALVDQSNASSLASPDLSDDRYLLSALLDHTPDSIYFKDVQGRFVKVNCIQAQRLQVSNPCEAIGKTDQDFFGGEHSKSALQDELEIIRSGLSWIDRQERRDWPAGNVTWASTSKRPLFDRAGKCIGILGISRDITSSKETESTLGHAQLPARRLYASAD
jgi:PAS domain S-box-containing protein